MSLENCRACGCDLQRQDGYFSCPACGSRWVFDVENDLNIFERSNAWADLRDYEFEKASSLFSKAISDNPNCHEAYWGRALADHGIIYTTVAYGGTKIPLFNKLSENSFKDLPDVKKAIKIAPKDVAEGYAIQADRIEAIRAEWIKKSSLEEPYEIFICCKDSDVARGLNQTEDSRFALQMYKALSSEGYRVFFGRECLQGGKISEHSEPYVYSALKSSKIMIVYGENADYFNDLLVKNEWGRFIERIKSEEKQSDSLFVAYKNISADDLPSALSGHQHFNATELTFFEKLMNRVQSIVPTPAQRIAEEEKQKAIEAQRALALRKEEKAIAAKKRKEAFKKFLKITFTVIFTLAILSAIVLGAIFLEKARHWIIAMSIALAYTLLWNLISYNSDLNYTPLYILTNLGLSIACIPMFCNGTTERIYAIGFALAVLASSIGLVFCSGTRIRENYETNIIVISILAGVVLFPISIGCLFSGFVAFLIVGCGIALMLIVSSVIVGFLDGVFDEEIIAVIFFVFHLILGLTSLVFAFLSFNFALLAVCFTASIIISSIIIIERFDEEFTLLPLFGGIIILLIALFYLIFFHHYTTDTFYVKNDVLISYGGKDEVVVLPENITTIGDRAFSQSGPKNNMKEAVLGDKIANIEIKAFNSCSTLEKIIIPSSVEKIDSYAFNSCINLETVEFEEGVEILGANVFENCDSLISVELPESLVEIGDYCFANCDKLKEIHIYSNVESIGSSVFTFVDKLTIYYHGTEEEWNEIEKPILFGWDYQADYDLVFVTEPTDESPN